MKKSMGRLINILSRAIQQDLKDVLAPFDISVGEEPYYMALIEEDGVSQDQLSKKVKVDKAATARMVKSLEEKGYLIRKIDSDDKRNKKLYLTKIGREKYEPIRDALINYNYKLTNQWSDEIYDLIYCNLSNALKQIENNKDK